MRMVRDPVCTICRCPLGYDANGEGICPNCPDRDGEGGRAMGREELEPYSLRYHLIYTWRRLTGQFRSFPEVKGMGYLRYRKTYLRRQYTMIFEDGGTS